VFKRAPLAVASPRRSANDPAVEASPEPDDATDIQN
jgi:hypothetical protein